jgi:hypothetical protein
VILVTVIEVLAVAAAAVVHVDKLAEDVATAAESLPVMTASGSETSLSLSS